MLAMKNDLDTTKYLYLSQDPCIAVLPDCKQTDFLGGKETKKSYCNNDHTTKESLTKCGQVKMNIIEENQQQLNKDGKTPNSNLTK